MNGAAVLDLDQLGEVGHRLLDVDERVAARVEDAEAVVAAHVHARRLDEVLVEGVDRDSAGRERLADGAVGEDHRAIIPRHGRRARNHGAGRARACARSRARAPRRRVGARRRGGARAGAIARGHRRAARWPGTVCGWKDCFDVAGLHTTGGAPWRFGATRAVASATIVARLEAAGAITIGKLAMTQLAWGMMGQTPGRPACRNPHDPARVPGGSSSGSAVAVASASSTTRRAPTPAAACGIRLRPAVSSGSSRPTARCRSTAACPTPRASTPAARSRAASRTRPRSTP